MRRKRKNVIKRKGLKSRVNSGCELGKEKTMFTYFCIDSVKYPPAVANIFSYLIQLY